MGPHRSVPIRVLHIIIYVNNAGVRSLQKQLPPPTQRNGGQLTQIQAAA